MSIKTTRIFRIICIIIDYILEQVSVHKMSFIHIMSKWCMRNDVDFHA